MKLLNSKPKLLFIVPWYFANLPRSIRAQNLIRHLHDSHECHVLCFDIPVAYDIKADAHVHKIPLTTFSKYVLQRAYLPHLKIAKPVLYVLRGLNYLLKKYVFFPDTLIIEITRIRSFLRELDEKHNFNKIILSVVPFSLLVILQKKEIGARTIADIGDPLSREMLFRSRKRFEERYLHLAGKIVVTNQNTKDYYIKERAIESDKLFVVRQGYDTATFRNENANSTFHYQELKLILTGSLYRSGLRDPDPLLNAMATFKKTSSIDMTYYGTSIDNDQIKRDVFQVLPKVDQTELCSAYKKHNLLVFIDNDNLLQTPGKIFELLAMKIPILFLFTGESETKKMLNDVDGIFFVENQYESILNFFNRIIDRKFTFTFDDWSKAASWERRTQEFREVLNE